jgi:glucokinase
MNVAIGVDIGGTNTIFGFVDSSGKCIHKQSIKTTDYPKAKQLVEAVASKCMLILDSNSELEPIGIGIGAPNGNYFNGTIEFAPNLEWDGIIDLVELFEDHFDLPVIVTNDANAAAIGEMMFGKTKGVMDFLMVTLGTGLGSGFVSNGELIYGHDGFAGELGHVVIEPNGRPCNCGHNGCLETYASATGLVKTAIELLKEKKEDTLLNSESLTSKSIAEAAEKGDALALECFDITADKLARGLATAIAITSPNTIVLFGGVANSGNLILAPLKPKLEEKLLKIFKNKIEIVISDLDDGNAAIIGAGALVWNELKENWYGMN